MNSHSSTIGAKPSTTDLLKQYEEIRKLSEGLCATLEPEDFVIQSMDDVSPTRWHLAHTSWFFETFLLKELLPDYRSPNPRYDYLFNSYYVSVGERHFRPHRGLLSRPTVAEVFAYRAHVDKHMTELLRSDAVTPASAGVIAVGLNHEQQHQELLLTDIKHVFSMNPLHPVFRERVTRERAQVQAAKWIDVADGVASVGHDSDAFAYDNESPRHRVFLEPARLADRLVTNAEFKEFIRSGGYKDERLWLSDGWAAVESQGWEAPLYWEQRDDQWWNFTLSGMREIDDSEPVCHVSYYEADAFARWAGRRLPTEFEWEVAARDLRIEGNFVDSGSFHPDPAPAGAGLKQMFGDVWEWTMSHYSPYPGYRPPEGAIGEYNGKFMCNQFVLRGGSTATSRNHMRITYRNFFPASARWQFSGIRLADDRG